MKETIAATEGGDEGELLIAIARGQIREQGGDEDVFLWEWRRTHLYERYGTKSGENGLLQLLVILAGHF